MRRQFLSDLGSDAIDDFWVKGPAKIAKYFRRRDDDELLETIGISMAMERFGKLELTNALIIDGADIEPAFARAARNIPNIDVLPVQGINVYDILRRKSLVLTKAAVEALEARFK